MRSLRIFFLIAIYLLIRSCVYAETQVSVSTSNNMATIGDRIQLKIIVKSQPDVEKITIDIPQAGFEVVSRQDLPNRTLKESRVFETNLFISYFNTGEYTVGPFTIHLFRGDEEVGSKQTNSLPITIKSVLKPEDKDIRNLREPIPLPGNPFYTLKYVLGMLLMGLIVFLMIFFIRKRRARRQEIPASTLSPLEEFESEVKALFERNLIEAGKIKEFFINLTDVVKHFLSREYKFKAEDFTTTETLYYLRRQEKEERVWNGLGNIFATSDLVKFAKFIPENSVYDKMRQELSAIFTIFRGRIVPEEEGVHVPSGQ